MISAFGIDHGGPIAKAAGAHRSPQRMAAIRDASMSHRGGSGYFHPSADQVSAAKARRAAQAAFKAGRPDRRVGAGRKLTLLTHVEGPLAAKALGAGALGAGAFGVVHHRTKVTKADRRDRAVNTGLGAVGGAGLTTAVSYTGGQTVKAVLKERRAARGESPREAAIWAKHKRMHGNRGTEAFAKYPKSLPDWKAQRALAFKNKPAVVAGTLAAGTLAGAAYGNHRTKVSKAGRSAAVEAVRWSAGLSGMGAASGGTVLAVNHRPREGQKLKPKPQRNKEAAGAALGAIAGQGVYQASGYGPKHLALRAERTISRSKRDKLLKPQKKAHGAFTPGMERHYPKAIPGWQAHRVLGWSHRGKAGTAVGVGATALGALAGARAMRKDKKR
jgi:hypothetical protein